MIVWSPAGCRSSTQGVVHAAPGRRLHAWLIEALYRSGRRAEVLGAYRDLWSRLDVELGVAPSREAQQLQRAILELDDSRVAARARRKG
jgi:DNA-binding SARP family transcriptional activator